MDHSIDSVLRDSMKVVRSAPFALVHGKFALPDQTKSDVAVVVEDGRISGICDPKELDPRIEVVDLQGQTVIPGLVDIHVHGALGASFNDATSEAIGTIVDYHLSRGVTSLLVTTSSAPVLRLRDAVAATNEWLRTPRQGSRVLGLHIEGPFFSPLQTGAQDADAIIEPDEESVRSLLSDADAVRIMTLAPELPGALDLVRQLVDRGIVAAAGHSAATDRDFAVAKEHGLSHVIHIWSSQSVLHREGPWRIPGLLEATLADDDVTVEMISDGKHLPELLMRLAYKCVGKDRLCIISDASSGTGLPEGTRYSEGGGMPHEVSGGVGMTLDRTSFAGSTTSLGDMVSVVTKALDIPIHVFAQMASTNPAKVIGADAHLGSIEVGKVADFVVLNEKLEPVRVMQAGAWV